MTITARLEGTPQKDSIEPVESATGNAIRERGVRPVLNRENAAGVITKNFVQQLLPLRWDPLTATPEAELDTVREHRRLLNAHNHLGGSAVPCTKRGNSGLNRSIPRFLRHSYEARVKPTIV